RFLVDKHLLGRRLPHVDDRQPITMPGPHLRRALAEWRHAGSLLTQGQALAHRPPPLTGSGPARVAAPGAGSGASPGAADSSAEAASTGWPPPPSEAGGRTDDRGIEHDGLPSSPRAGPAARKFLTNATSRSSP